MISKKAKRAIAKYGESACVRAFNMHAKMGYGARGIAEQGPESIHTTAQADAAINAGREIVANETAQVQQ